MDSIQKFWIVRLVLDQLIVIYYSVWSKTNPTIRNFWILTITNLVIFWFNWTMLTYATMAHQVLPQNCWNYLLMVTFEYDENYLIRFKITNNDPLFDSIQNGKKTLYLHSTSLLQRFCHLCDLRKDLSAVDSNMSVSWENQKLLQEIKDCHDYSY